MKQALKKLKSVFRLTRKGPLAALEKGDIKDPQSIEGLHCPSCGYDLRMHLCCETCPECGGELNLDYWEKQVRDERKSIKRLKIAMIVIAQFAILNIAIIPTLDVLLEWTCPKIVTRSQTFYFKQHDDTINEQYSYTLITSEKTIFFWSSLPDDYKHCSLHVEAQVPFPHLTKKIDFYFRATRSYKEPVIKQTFDASHFPRIIKMFGLSELEMHQIAITGFLRNNGAHDYNFRITQAQLTELWDLLHKHEIDPASNIQNLVFTTSEDYDWNGHHPSQFYLFWLFFLAINGILIEKTRKSHFFLFRLIWLYKYVSVAFFAFWLFSMNRFALWYFDQYYCCDYLSITEWHIKNITKKIKGFIYEFRSFLQIFLGS